MITARDVPEYKYRGQIVTQLSRVTKTDGKPTIDLVYFCCMIKPDGQAAKLYERTRNDIERRIDILLATNRPTN